MAPDTHDDWLTISAAALLVGAMALVLATALSPTADTPEDTLMVVQEQGGRWLAGAVMYFFAAVGLTLGTPTLLAAAPGAGRRFVRVGVVFLAIGYVGIAGFASLLIFIHSLVVSAAIDSAGLELASTEAGLEVFLYGWIGAFYLGELILAVGLLRAGRADVPRWIPVLLLLHVFALALAGGPDWVAKVVTVLLALALSGLAIRVVQGE